MGRKTKKNTKGNQASNSPTQGASSSKSSVAVSISELSKSSKRDLSELINNLLEICSKPLEFRTKELEDYPDIYNLVDKIQQIQSVLSLPEHNRHQDFPVFIKWLNDNGVSTTAVEIVEFEGYGFGLKAAQDFKEGDRLLCIPRKLMMTVDTANESALGPLIAEDKILQVMPNVTLALHLLNERFSKQSFWKPYIDILPSQYSTPLYWKPVDLQHLKGSPVQDDAVNQYRNIARQYAYFYRLLQKNPLANTLPLKDNFTYENYRWAVSSVMTRQNQIPARDGSRSTLGLIPLWDMCNHTNGVYTSDYSAEDDACECFCLKDFSVDQQVFIFYGPRSNGEFLVHNGFVYPENEHDRLCFKLGISKDDPLYALKSEVLEKLNIAPSRSFYLHKGRFPVDGDLLSFLRVFSMDEVTLKEGYIDGSTSSPENLDNLKNEDQIVNKENENKVWSFLQTRAQLLIKAYTCSLEEDESLLQQADVCNASKMAAQLRIGERQILQNMINYAEQKKDELTSASN
uniref:protein-histidine N-methyltransferase n=1 Tax=Arion vulgaris TaxID=1028688 RepID=A0A0B7BBI2_9EUPU